MLDERGSALNQEVGSFRLRAWVAESRWRIWPGAPALATPLAREALPAIGCFSFAPAPGPGRLAPRAARLRNSWHCEFEVGRARENLSQTSTSPLCASFLFSSVPPVAPQRPPVAPLRRQSESRPGPREGARKAPFGRGRSSVGSLAAAAGPLLRRAPPGPNCGRPGAPRRGSLARRLQRGRRSGARLGLG